MSLFDYDSDAVDDVTPETVEEEPTEAVKEDPKPKKKAKATCTVRCVGPGLATFEGEQYRPGTEYTVTKSVCERMVAYRESRTGNIRFIEV